MDREPTEVLMPGGSDRAEATNEVTGEDREPTEASSDADQMTGRRLPLMAFKRAMEENASSLGSIKAQCRLRRKHHL